MNESTTSPAQGDPLPDAGRRSFRPITKQLPSLNGWRAVAILLVLAQHTDFINGFPWKGSAFLKEYLDGTLGVRFFFTISGFLITWLMLKEEGQFHRVSLKNFYIRRTLRIWPVYFCYVAVLAILQLSGIAMQHGYAWRGMLTFTRNLFDERSPFDDSAGVRYDGLSAHLWSLSIEEQFYLVWPVIFCLGKGNGRIWFLVFAIALSEGFNTLKQLGLYDHNSVLGSQEHTTLRYVDCLAWGCLAGIYFSTNKEAARTYFEKYGPYLFSISFCMVALPYVLRFGAGIQALGFSILMLHSVVCPDRFFYRHLNTRWMTRIGVLSYSIYIWQEIVFTAWPVSLGPIWFLWIPVAIGMAWISYKYLEEPFFRLRARFHDPHANISNALKENAQ